MILTKLRFKKLIELISQSTEWEWKMYMLWESYKKDIDKKFDVKRLAITDSVKDFLKVELLSNLSIIDERITTHDLCDYFTSGMELDVYLIPHDKIDSFPSVLNKINHYDSLEPINIPKDIKRSTSYIIEVKTDKINRILYFIRFTPKQFLEKKGIFSLRQSTLNLFDGNVFLMNDLLDCIHFELPDEKENAILQEINDPIDETYKKSFIILNKTNFEKIFRFNEYYKSFAIETIETENFNNFITLSDDVIESLKKVTLARKITNLETIWGVDENLKNALVITKNKINDLNYEIIDQKIVINNEKGLTDFLDVWEDNIAKTIAFDKCYRVKSKKEFRT